MCLKNNFFLIMTKNSYLYDRFFVSNINFTTEHVKKYLTLMPVTQLHKTNGTGLLLTWKNLEFEKL